MFGYDKSVFSFSDNKFSIALRSRVGKRLLAGFVLASLAAVGLTFYSVDRVAASGTISGTVYIDYNMNGVRNTSGAAPNHAVDKGIGSITVTAYDSSGTVRGTDTTSANGGFSISATGTGPYRVEFSGLPAGYMPSAIGTNNDSTVRFVPDGNSSGIDLGVVSEKEYCQNNPDLVTTCFSGTVAGNSADPVLISFPYTSGTTSTTDSTGVDNPGSHTLAVPQNQFGAIWGLAYHRTSQLVFASAFTKRHAGFRNNTKGSASSDPTGEIFVSNPTGTSATVFVNLNTLFGSNVAGDNPHDTADYGADLSAFDAVGKAAIGDIDISDDEETLFVTNLADRKIYAIPLGTGTPTAPTLPGQVTVYNLAAIMDPGTGATGCPLDGTTPAGEMNLNLRPGALKYKDDRLYVGLTCTAQSTGLTTDLRAFVYEMNPAGAGSAVQVANFALDYPRGCASDTGTECAPAEWQPWTNSVAALLDFTPWGQKYLPQPWLLDIEFDQNDFMILGVADRLGHQTGNDNAGANTGTVEGVSAGETLRMYKNGAVWTLENNASDNTNTTTGAGNGEGPGGGEFYYEEGYTITANTHSEISLGGLVNIPGFQDVAVSAFDPAPTGTLSGQNTYRAGGLVWLNNNTGSRSRSYQLFSIDAPNTFGKASGVGDLVAMCDTAPIQVGNRVWNDADGDGIQDPGEAAFANVALEFWADTDGDGNADTQIGSALTDVNGNYVFGGAGNTNLGTHQCGGKADMRVNASTDDAEQNSSDSSILLTGVDLDFFSEEGNTPYFSPLGVRFNNVSIPAGATITNAYLEFTANDSTVSAGNPTITVQAQDADNPGTFTGAVNDIGSRPLTTQSVVWNPTAWTNSSIEQTPDLTNVVQEVVNRGGWANGNSMAFILSGAGSAAFREAESFDGSPGEAPRLVVDYTVPGTCSYEISPITAYEVRVAPANFGSGQPLENFYPTTPDADGTGNGDSRDSDGIIFPGDIVTAQFTTGSSYGDNDHTFDFGFRAAGAGQPNHSIGNRVWYDTNNDGVIDPAEVGISGVSVSLFLDAGGDGVPDTPGSPVDTVLTDADGYYRFDSLPANIYLVRINPSNFGAAEKLEGHQNTAGNNTGDMESFGAGSNAENGINPSTASDVLANGILSNPITLAAGAEPTSEADVPSSGAYSGQGAFDDFADMTVDFGFFCLRLSGTVWHDVGAGPDSDDGELDVGEATLPNYTVRLYDSGSTEIQVGPDGILGTADDGAGGVLTDGSGEYLFECLPEGDYRVVLQANGSASSGPTETDPDSNGDNNDNGYPDDTGFFTGQLISGVVTLNPGSTGAGGNNTVDNSQGSTSDPTIDFGIFLSPTQVKLDRFEASFKEDAVVLEWSTGGESDNLGFNVYRSTKGGSELLNAAPIAGSALRSRESLNVSSNDYRWVEKGADPDSAYFIEDIDLDGTRTIHGPVRPKLDFSFDIAKPSSALLTSLNRSPHRQKQTEIVVESKKDLQGLAGGSTISKQREIAGKQGIKISVPANDLYTLTFEQLAAFGFDITANSATWQMFADASEVPIEITEAGSAGRRIRWYGRKFESRFTGEQVYYLVNGEADGLRIKKRPEPGGFDTAPAASYRVTAVNKDRSLYASSILNGERENWFGSPILASGDTSVELNAFDIEDSDSEAAVLRVRLQGLSNGAHLVAVSFNGVQIGTTGFTGQENREFEFKIPMSSIVDGANVVSMRSVGTGNDVSLVDQTRLRYSRLYRAREGKVRFSVPAGKAVRIGGFEEESFEVFELDRSGKAFRRLIVSNEKVDGAYGFSIGASETVREFAAFARSYRSKVNPEIEPIRPSKWNDKSNGADVLILAPRRFGKQAEELASLKKIQGLEAAVVSIEDIYDEFGFGKKSDNAIREFIYDTQTEWSGAPGYIILFGDSSFDMRNYLGQPERDQVPTRLIDTSSMETSSDAWFADFDGDGVEDVPIGRLPAGTIEEARAVVRKLKRYRTQSMNPKRRGLLIADRTFENFSDALASLLPKDVEAMRLDRSSFTDQVLRSRIVNEINRGPISVTYTGHGSTGIWAGSDVFGVSDAAALGNEKLSFFMLMTCLNGFTHNAHSDSLSESLFKSENGAIAVWASSGLTRASQQFPMSEHITDRLYGNVRRIGDLTREAKLATDDLDVRRTWQLIGDPTLIIK